VFRRRAVLPTTPPSEVPACREAIAEAEGATVVATCVEATTGLAGTREAETTGDISRRSITRTDVTSRTICAAVDGRRCEVGWQLFFLLRCCHLFFRNIFIPGLGREDSKTRCEESRSLSRRRKTGSVCVAGSAQNSIVAGAPRLGEKVGRMKKAREECRSGLGVMRRDLSCLGKFPGDC